ncbi:MAG: ketopantoate reductase family protein [Promethearchaeota archaeon]
MKVLIYGCGAIGSVFASFIKASPNGQSNKNEIYLLGREKIISPIKKEGIFFYPYNMSGQNRHNDGDALYTEGYIASTSLKDITDLEKMDAIIFTLKAYDFKNSLMNLKQEYIRRGLIPKSRTNKTDKTSNTDNTENTTQILSKLPYMIISMNGLGLKEILLKVFPDYPRDKIVELIVGFPCKIDGNKVFNTGGNSFFSFEQTPHTLNLMEKLFGINPLKEHEFKYKNMQFSFPFRADPEFIKTKWKKAIANITINGISAISMMNIGEILKRKSLKSIIKELINETMEIINKLNIDLGESKEEIYRWLLEFAGKDPHHKTSTFQDVLKGKKTEIDFMNGYIVKKGRELGMEVSVNESIVNLIKAIERNYKNEL